MRTALLKLSIVLSSIFLFLILKSCEVSQNIENDRYDFGIYLTRNEILPNLLEMQSQIEPADAPLITIEDIVSYTWSNHEIRLTEKGKNILDTLKVSVYGRSFVVCVNKVVKYHGAFWTLISSVSFTGPTIILPKLSPYVIRVTLNYPPALQDTEPDVRNNTDIKKALQSAGKLL